MPCAERCERVLLRFEPLEDQHRSIRASPEARHPWNAVEHHRVGRSLDARGHVFAHRDLACDASRDPWREDASTEARAPSRGEMARRENWRTVDGASGDGDCLGNCHVGVTEVATTARRNDRTAWSAFAPGSHDTEAPSAFGI